ncbi:MAG TPA: winged helix-turn-helix domain-containing protein, partial [Actinophytocola sp.]|nr:winged helix-turn-helix domain-containing protein [Actinophytocola sp.]
MQNRHPGAEAPSLYSLQRGTRPAEATRIEHNSLPGNDSGRAIVLGLLGPLVLVRGGAVVTPSAPKLRQVLSLLAVQANAFTRVDQLVEELWEVNPPQSALTTVQTYIYQLRKL